MTISLINFPTVTFLSPLQAGAGSHPWGACASEKPSLKVISRDLYDAEL